MDAVDAEPDELDTRRAALPLGSIVRGTVTPGPTPGVVGVFVDLGSTAPGFVDLLELPRDPADWPDVGDVWSFEVVQHRESQIRLRPADPARRGDPDRRRYPDATWRAITTRCPVGAEVEAVVTQVFANRECSVEHGDLHETVEWSGEPPIVGARTRFRVEAHLDSLLRVVLRRL